MIDWKTMPEGREKYHAYLASSNWAWRRMAVNERCGGICEKCKTRPMQHVHHQTYIRKYAEKLEDLAGLCEQCHSELHSVSAPVHAKKKSTRLDSADTWVYEVAVDLLIGGMSFEHPRIESLCKIHEIRSYELSRLDAAGACYREFRSSKANLAEKMTERSRLALLFAAKYHRQRTRRFI